MQHSQYSTCADSKNRQEPIYLTQFGSSIPLRVTRNCLSAGRYGFLLLGSPASLRAHARHTPDQSANQPNQQPPKSVRGRPERGERGERRTHQDQVGHLATRLSPARMNSGTDRTPFSRNAETVRGAVTRSTVPL